MAAALGRTIGSHALLLVIDDAWHLEDALALVQRQSFRNALPHGRILLWEERMPHE
jgi:hypothetical protein